MQIAATPVARPTDLTIGDVRALQAARDNISGAVSELRSVARIAGSDTDDIDQTRPYWTMELMRGIGSAQGRLEALRGVFALDLGLDFGNFGTAFQELQSASAKLTDAVDRSGTPWRPLFKMVAKDALDAIGAFERFDADLARHVPR